MGGAIACELTLAQAGPQEKGASTEYYFRQNGVVEEVQPVLYVET